MNKNDYVRMTMLIDCIRTVCHKKVPNKAHFLFKTKLCLSQVQIVQLTTEIMNKFRIFCFDEKIMARCFSLEDLRLLVSIQVIVQKELLAFIRKNNSTADETLFADSQPLDDMIKRNLTVALFTKFRLPNFDFNLPKDFRTYGELLRIATCSLEVKERLEDFLNKQDCPVTGKFSFEDNLKEDLGFDSLKYCELADYLADKLQSDFFADDELTRWKVLNDVYLSSLQKMH